MRGKELLPYDTIVKVTNNLDRQAVEEVVNHYSGYIATLSLNEYYDTLGFKHYGVNEDIKNRIETILLQAISNFEIQH